MHPFGRFWIAVGLGLSLAASAMAEDLKIGIRTETTSIDPNFWTTTENGQIADHFFNGLVLKDHRNQLTPGLATAWSLVDENTWEFTLRRGVRFHDGSPFTADDVVFTFDRAQKIVGSSAPSGRFLAGKTYRKVDDYTVRISPGKPYPLLPNELTVLYVVSRKIGEAASVEDFNAGRAAFGTGPYRFVEWVKGDRIVMERNPDYWGGAPEWQRVVFKPIPSDPSRLSALLNVDVDVINAVPTIDSAKLRGNPNFVLSEIPGERIVFLELDSNRDLSPFVRDNEGNPLWPNPLREWRVRKAISKAIDRQAIVERMLDGAAVAAGQLAAPGMFGFNSDLKPEPYDPDGARRLMAQAGYADGFRLTLHGTTDDHPNDAKVAEAIAGMLARIGIRTEVATMPKATYYLRARQGGEYKLPEFSFFLYSFGTETGETSAQMWSILHTTNAERNFGHSNRGRYSNVRADARLEEALVTLDDAKREALLKEASAIYINDVAIVPLHYQANLWGLRKGLTYKARVQEATHAMAVSRRP